MAKTASKKKASRKAREKKEPLVLGGPIVELLPGRPERPARLKGEIHSALLFRLPDYVFAVTDGLKAKAIAAGKDVIDFSMGNPDGRAPEQVVRAAAEALQESGQHRYPDPRGTLELRRAAADWYARRYDVALDPEKQLLVTLGAKEGIAHLQLALLGPEDAVVVPSPAYPVHHYAAVIAGATPVGAPVGPGIDFIGGIEAAVAKAGSACRGIVCSFPHNPTGVAAPPGAFARLVEIAKERGLWILHDLAYADMHFGREQAESFLSTPGALEVGVEFVSLSKSYNMAGFRVGFCAGRPEMVAALARVKRYFDYGLFGVAQAAGRAALEQCADFPRQMCELYRKRRNALLVGLSEAGWNIPVPEGGMFAWAKIPDRYSALSSVEFAQLVLERTSVALSPGSGFGPGGEGYVRFALIQDEARILEACRRIGQILA